MSVELQSKQVHHFMSRAVVTVRPGDTVREALDVMVENGVSAVPVVDRAGICVGMLSASDLLDLTRELEEGLHALDAEDGVARLWMADQLSDQIGHERVDNRMTENVVGISRETPISRAAREMLRNRVHRLPVVDGNGRLVGILSTMDLLGALAE